ncbi:hypothetical protein JXA34_02315 [Patescibacteria group bacterium]|nr:hypothetical protein [Patescibacteria group bacterium]
MGSSGERNPQTLSREDSDRAIPIEFIKEEERILFEDVSHAQEQALKPLRELSSDQFVDIANGLYGDLVEATSMETGNHVLQEIGIMEEVIDSNDTLFPGNEVDKSAYKRMAVIIAMLHDRGKDRAVRGGTFDNIVHAHEGAREVREHLTKYLGNSADVKTLCAFVAQTIERHSDITWIQEYELGNTQIAPESDPPLTKLAKAPLGTRADPSLRGLSNLHMKRITPEGKVTIPASDLAPYFDIKTDDEGIITDIRLPGPESDIEGHDRAKWDHLLRSCDTLSNYLLDPDLESIEPDRIDESNYAGIVKIASFIPKGTLADKVQIIIVTGKAAINEGMYEHFPSLTKRAERSNRNMERLSVILEQDFTEANVWGEKYGRIRQNPETTEEEHAKAVKQLTDYMHQAIGKLEDELKAEAENHSEKQ